MVMSPSVMYGTLPAGLIARHSGELQNSGKKTDGFNLNSQIKFMTEPDRPHRMRARDVVNFKKSGLFCLRTAFAATTTRSTVAVADAKPNGSNRRCPHLDGSIPQIRKY